MAAVAPSRTTLVRFSSKSCASVLRVPNLYYKVVICQLELRKCTSRTRLALQSCEFPAGAYVDNCAYVVSLPTRGTQRPRPAASLRHLRGSRRNVAACRCIGAQIREAFSLCSLRTSPREPNRPSCLQPQWEGGGAEIEY